MITIKKYQVVLITTTALALGAVVTGKIPLSKEAQAVKAAEKVIDTFENPPKPEVVPADTRSTCRKALDTVLEREGHGVCTPLHTLMYSIITVESAGMTRKNAENAVLINRGVLRDKSVYFDSPRRALDAIDALRVVSRIWGAADLYTDSLDLGCSQVNWHYHAKRFDNDISKAFVPEINVQVALGIVREQMTNDKTPYQIAGNYHRRVQDTQQQTYIGKFRSVYDKRSQDCLYGRAR